MVFTAAPRQNSPISESTSASGGSDAASRAAASSAPNLPNSRGLLRRVEAGQDRTVRFACSIVTAGLQGGKRRRCASASWSSAITPKPTRQHPFRLRVEQHDGRDRGAAEPELRGTSVVRRPPRASPPAPRRSATPPARRGRGGIAEGAQQRAEHPAAGAAGMAEIDEPVALAEPSRAPGRGPPPGARPTRAAWRARPPDAFSGVVHVPASPRPCGGRRRRRWRPSLQRLPLQAQIRGHVLRGGIEDRRGAGLLQRACAVSPDAFRRGPLVRDRLRGLLCGVRCPALPRSVAVAVEVPAERRTVLPPLAPDPGSRDTRTAIRRPRAGAAAPGAASSAQIADHRVFRRVFRGARHHSPRL